jgi:phosphoserine phosphatase
MADPIYVTRPSRPIFDGSLRGRSYLEEHQQYRPPHQDGHQGIDSIIERVTMKSSPTRTPSTYKGVPSPKTPPKVIESGLNHTFSHTNCQPPAGQSSNRMIATLFYKSKTDRISNTIALHDRSPEINMGFTLPANLAPTTSFSLFPLEPPPPDPEPLDHLYGSYVSPLCITSFLHLLTSFPLPQGSASLTSSHRCLDDPNHPRVVEITFSPAPDPAYLTVSDLRKHELLYRFEREWNIDIVLQPDTPLRRYPRLVVLDMDSTLIEEEVVDLIAASIGVEPQVSAITARAMNGELDFAASLRERAALLKGVDATVFTSLRSVVTPTRGARELIRALKRLGVRTAVLSGGFIPLTQWLADDLGIDHAYANTLGSADGKLTGEVEGPIVDAERKAALLLEVAAKHQIDLSQVIAVGDGANDLLMMKEAALGVAFNAKPRVQLEAAARLNGESLLDLLFLLGFTEEEVGVLVR